MKLRRERGDVPVGCLVGLVVLAMAALIGIKATPIMVNVGELDREITSLADRAGRRDPVPPSLPALGRASGRLARSWERCCSGGYRAHR